MAATDIAEALRPTLARFEDLNEIFNHDLVSLKTYEEALSASEKILARKWIQKLVQTPESVDFYIRRNEYIHLLLSQAQKHKLTPPFCQPPPGDSVLPPLSEACVSADDASSNIFKLEETVSKKLHTASLLESQGYSEESLSLVRKARDDITKYMGERSVTVSQTLSKCTLVHNIVPTPSIQVLRPSQQASGESLVYSTSVQRSSASVPPSATCSSSAPSSSKSSGTLQFIQGKFAVGTKERYTVKPKPSNVQSSTSTSAVSSGIINATDCAEFNIVANPLEFLAGPPVGSSVAALLYTPQSINGSQFFFAPRTTSNQMPVFESSRVHVYPSCSGGIGADHTPAEICNKQLNSNFGNVKGSHLGKRSYFGLPVVDNQEQSFRYNDVESLVPPTCEEMNQDLSLGSHNATVEANPADTLKLTYKEKIIYCLYKKEMTLSTLYKCLSDNFPGVAKKDVDWKSNVRHVLSVNGHFIHVPHRGLEQQRGDLWTINPIYSCIAKKIWQRVASVVDGAE